MTNGQEVAAHLAQGLPGWEQVAGWVLEEVVSQVLVAPDRSV